MMESPKEQYKKMKLNAFFSGPYLFVSLLAYYVEHFLAYSALQL